jgi:hypothetical protein
VRKNREEGRKEGKFFSKATPLASVHTRSQSLGLTEEDNLALFPFFQYRLFQA